MVLCQYDGAASADPVTAAAALQRRRRGPGEAEWWLRGAAAVLAGAAAAVSWQAQYVMVLAVKHAQAVAAVKAGIPDAEALIFAALGVAGALYGRRPLRPWMMTSGMAPAMQVGAAAIEEV